MLPVALNLFDAIEQKLLHEPSIQYRAEIAYADEEEIFVRGGVFKKLIPRIHNNTCCISGMQIIAGNTQLIDACHIVPFSESHDDTVSNGLSLCPNLHRAFDRHLVTIDESYRVVVSPHFAEGTDSYSIRQFAGKQVLLPRERRYYPSQENLAKHRSRFERVNV
ncbi:MAG: HNH endonuclease [Flavipsychrobacter sp.]|nr:HNH endonuclease [Flavipsychrobacter sp.]